MQWMDSRMHGRVEEDRLIKRKNTKRTNCSGLTNSIRLGVWNWINIRSIVVTRPKFALRTRSSCWSGTEANFWGIILLPKIIFQSSNRTARDLKVPSTPRSWFVSRLKCGADTIICMAGAPGHKYNGISATFQTTGSPYNSCGPICSNKACSNLTLCDLLSDERSLLIPPYLTIFPTPHPPTPSPHPSSHDHIV